MISQVSPNVEVAANWRPTLTHDVPSTLLLRINSFLNISFDMYLQNVQNLQRCAKTNNKRIFKKNRREKLNLKVKII